MTTFAFTQPLPTAVDHSAADATMSRMASAIESTFDFDDVHVELIVADSAGRTDYLVEASGVYGTSLHYVSVPATDEATPRVVVDGHEWYWDVAVSAFNPYDEL